MFEHVTSRAGKASWLRRTPAWVKLALAVAVVVTVALLPMARAGFLAVVAVVAAVLVVLALASGVGLWGLAKRLLKAEPLALGVAGLAFFQPHGWVMAGILLAKSTLCLFTMVLLAASTPFAEILAVLRRIRVPGLLVMTIALMVRYVGVLGDEAHRMRRARMSRSFETSRVGQWMALGGVIGHLFVRATERAERIYAAMCARGGGA